MAGDVGDPGLGERALFRALPRLTASASDLSPGPWVRIGSFPTPIESLSLLDALEKDLWVKRDDLSADRYGGNKVRTLEVLFAAARKARARRIWAVGAVGSNHALATVLHAPAADLEAGVMLFPQPVSACARENFEATLAARPALRSLWSWASVPFAILAERRRPGSFVMVPGGATPEGALGYVSAALEVVEQARTGAVPLPRRIVIGAGSTCTSAGLVAGFAIAARLGLIERRAVPKVIAVRVTPWPVTAAFRIVGLAGRTAALVAALAGDSRLAVDRSELGSRLGVLGQFLGRGYGYVTAAGLRAVAAFAAAGGPPLDTCYSGKAAAGLFDAVGHRHGVGQGQGQGQGREGDGPTLFWATKSSRPLPAASDSIRDLSPTSTATEGLPRGFRRWLGRPDLPLPIVETDGVEGLKDR